MPTRRSARTYNGTLADLLQRATAQLERRPADSSARNRRRHRRHHPLRAATPRNDERNTPSPICLRSSLHRPAEQFREYPLLRTALLDIERDPAEQGFELGGYDIVIAANVLHATADMHQTMTHVGRLLAPGGISVRGRGSGARAMGQSDLRTDRRLVAVLAM